MSHTFTKLSVHAVFSTKDRVELITPPLSDRLHPNMKRFIDYGFGLTRQIGGTANHSHVLFDLNPNVSVAECMRHVKSVSSGWVHNVFPNMAHFGWQPGYGAFSVSSSGIGEVQDYIMDQEEHHRTGGFEREFRALLEKHGIPYDPQFLWK